MGGPYSLQVKFILWWQRSVQGSELGIQMGSTLHLFLNNPPMAAKGKEPFYEKFGFSERPNENLGAGMDQWFLLENWKIWRDTIYDQLQAWLRQLPGKSEQFDT